MSDYLPAGIGALTFAADETALPYLFLFAFVWVLSGVYTALTTPAADRARIFAYFLPSALGGITVAVAADAVSFYLAFALMAIPAWGLITHDGSREARRAGAIYLSVTVIGEALLLAALAILAVEARSTSLAAMAAAIPGSAARDVVLWLLIGSIGLKIGSLPACGILPLSYTYTPAGPASALAGASAKVGALAMLRLLPAGGLPETWASAVMLLGLTTAFVAAALGVLTTAPRAVLGYSSASQMGLVLIAAGAGLADASVAPLAHSAIIAFSLHHGLAKSALVLGDDVVSRSAGRLRRVALVALALPALALVGAPLTSGFVAKYALKDALSALSGAIPHAIYLLLPWTAVGTAALMIRFFALSASSDEQRTNPSPGPVALWALMLGAVALVCWVWPAGWNDHATSTALDVASAWTATWPSLIALAAALTVRSKRQLTGQLAGVVPPGDLLLGIASTVGAVDRALHVDLKRHRRGGHAWIAEELNAAESRAMTWVAASATVVVLAIILVLLAAG